MKREQIGVEGALMARPECLKAQASRRAVLRAVYLGLPTVIGGGLISACLGDSSRDEDGYYKFARTRPRGTYEYDPQERERLRQEYQPSGGS
jgi:hypothetical protein